MERSNLQKVQTRGVCLGVGKGRGVSVDVEVRS